MEVLYWMLSLESKVHSSSRVGNSLKCFSLERISASGVNSFDYPHYAIIIRDSAICSFASYYTSLDYTQENIVESLPEDERAQCIHNIDFDFHYFQFRFIVCKVKHKIENRSEREMSKGGKIYFPSYNFHIDASQLIFCVYVALSLSFVIVQLKWVQNKMIKKGEWEVLTVAIDFKGVQSEVDCCCCCWGLFSISNNSIKWKIRSPLKINA